MAIKPPPRRPPLSKAVNQPWLCPGKINNSNFYSDLFILTLREYRPAGVTLRGVC